jgi:hypothetical protein
MQLFLGLRDHAAQERYMAGLFAIYAVRSAAAGQGVLATRLLTEAWRVGASAADGSYSGYLISIFDDMDDVPGITRLVDVPGPMLSLIIGDGHENGVERSVRSTDSGALAKSAFKRRFLAFHGKPRVPDAVVAMGQFAPCYFAFYSNTFPDDGKVTHLGHGLCRFCFRVPDSPAHLAACTSRGLVLPVLGFPVVPDHVDSLVSAAGVIPPTHAASLAGFTASALLSMWREAQELDDGGHLPSPPVFKGMCTSITLPALVFQPHLVLKELNLVLVPARNLQQDQLWCLEATFTALLGLDTTDSPEFLVALRTSALRCLLRGDLLGSTGPFAGQTKLSITQNMAGVPGQGIKGLAALCNLYSVRVQVVIFRESVVLAPVVVNIGRLGDRPAGTLAKFDSIGDVRWFIVTEKVGALSYCVPSARVESAPVS